MVLFESYYDTDGDGALTGFERVRYEEENLAYPGSQVPDYANEMYERELRGGSKKRREYTYDDYCEDQWRRGEYAGESLLDDDDDVDDCDDDGALDEW